MSKKQRIQPAGWEVYEHLTFAPAVRKGNMLYMSGNDATQVDPQTGKWGIKGDIVQQYGVIFEKLKVILDAAGGSFEDVVWTCDYLRTKEGYKGTAAVRREYFGNSFPASSGIVVKELLSKDALIEMDAVAILDT